MAIPLRSSRWHSLLWALAAATAQSLQPGHAAAARNDPVAFEAASTQGTPFENMTLVKPIVTQGSSLLSALKGEFVSPTGDTGNGTWKLTGEVHLEFDGAVMDAQAATAVFVKDRLVSVVMQAVAPQLPKKLVHVVFKSAVLDVDNATVDLSEGRIKTIQALGTPAQFSYQLKKQGQVNGRADKIDYDAVKDSILFSGDTRYTDGKNNDAKTSWLTYNFSDGLSATGPITTTIRREDRVPQPRTPDRATAK